jgi:hypothetical protein
VEIGSKPKPEEKALRELISPGTVGGAHVHLTIWTEATSNNTLEKSVSAIQTPGNILPGV